MQNHSKSIGTVYLDWCKQTNEHKCDHYCAKNILKVKCLSYAWKRNSFNCIKTFLGWKSLLPRKGARKAWQYFFSKTWQRTNRLGIGMPDKALMPLQFKT